MPDQRPTIAETLSDHLETNLDETQADLRNWLFDSALPLWWNTGGDTHKGGFFEKLNLDGTPNDINRRTRVAARQVFTYALAKRMGYTGDADAPIDQGLRWLDGPARNPDTGMLYAVLTPDGEVMKAGFDFYDHAFALLAYASAFTVRPHDKSLEDKAVAIRDTIVRDYSHPVRGFEESNPRTLPLKTNPHMHMFEACLAWIEAGGDDTWRQIAAMIADLCLDKFLNPVTGALREYFDGDWNPMAGDEGRIVEPGHQFEWSWLLMRWAKMTGDDRFHQAALRLLDIGEVAGTDPVRDVAFAELWDDFTPKDKVARLWSQTERTKAYVKLCEASTAEADRHNAIAKAIQGAAGLKKYFDVTHLPLGLYRDRMKADGTFEIEPAPASSLYHIICGIDEFLSLKA
jgi:mannose/cellobiose epimerase-like protein (N-acyl-D-glucosamine 2-epimerase family)